MGSSRPGLLMTLARAGVLDAVTVERLDAEGVESCAEVVQRGCATWAAVLEALAIELFLPQVTLSRVQPGLALHRVPAAVADAHGVFPVLVTEGRAGSELLVATSDPYDRGALDACSDVSGLRARALLATPAAIADAIAVHYHGRAPRTAVPPRPPPPAPRRGPAATTAPPSPSVVEPPPIPRSPLVPDMAAPAPTPPTPAPAHGPTMPCAEPAPPSSRGSRSLPPSDGPRADVLSLQPGVTLKAACDTACAAVGMRHVEADLLTVGVLAKALRPLLLVVPEDAYAFDRGGLARLAIESGAALVVWSDDVTADDIAALVAAARSGSPRRASSIRPASTQPPV